MQLTLQDDLAFARLTIAYQGRTIDVDHVLIDTGSASTILAAREVANLGIAPEMDDIVYAVRGVGGVKPCLHAESIRWQLKRTRSLISRSKSAV